MVFLVFQLVVHTLQSYVPRSVSVCLSVKVRRQLVEVESLPSCGSHRSATAHLLSHIPSPDGISSTTFKDVSKRYSGCGWEVLSLRLTFKKVRPRAPAPPLPA